MLPAYIDFSVSAPDYKPIITQLFDRRDKHDDPVPTAKESLAIDFLPRGADPEADLEVPYEPTAGDI